MASGRIKKENGRRTNRATAQIALVCSPKGKTVTEEDVDVPTATI